MPNSKAGSHIDLFLRRMEAQWKLGSEEQEALAKVACAPHPFAKSAYFTEQGQDVDNLLILCDGVAQSVRSFSDGRQQILEVFVPGDLLGIAGFTLGYSQLAICALTSGSASHISRNNLRALIARYPSIADALQRETASAIVLLQEHMTCLGQRDAHGRVAHFLCELSYRFESAGVGGRHASPLPLTQSEIGDALGLSTVHVNRILQQLRMAHLIELRGGRLTITDPNTLYRIAEFEPSYLPARSV